MAQNDWGAEPLAKDQRPGNVVLTTANSPKNTRKRRAPQDQHVRNVAQTLLAEAISDPGRVAGPKRAMAWGLQNPKRVAEGALTAARIAAAPPRGHNLTGCDACAAKDKQLRDQADYILELRKEAERWRKRAQATEKGGVAHE